MKTYLPYPDIRESIQCLEGNALADAQAGVVKTLAVLHQLIDIEPFYGDPEIELWKGHEPYLCEYGFILADRVAVEQNPDTAKRLAALMQYHLTTAMSGSYTIGAPNWFGEYDFHTAEQSALLRIDPVHYRKFFPVTALDIPPFWSRTHHA